MFHDSFGLSLQPSWGELLAHRSSRRGPTDWRRNFDAALV